jgi:ABC-type Zn uptake system ZnuABC Zn-binding protein ZnuA
MLIHPFQAYLAEKLGKLNRKNAAEVLKTGALNTPADYMSGLMETESILMKYFPQRQSEFDNSRQLLYRQMEKKTAEDIISNRKNAMKKINVLSSVLQVNFSRYSGFEVAGVFASPDGLTPEKLKAIVKEARAKKVKYIISNLTGDNDMTADIINKQLKVRKITLSSFPREEGTGSWFFNMYDYNMARIKDAFEAK